MAPRETENNAYAKFWSDQQRVLWYVMVFSRVFKLHVTLTGHNQKRDHFEILARGRSDTHCKIKETLLIKDLNPPLNENVSSENFYVFKFVCFINMQISHNGSSIIYLIR